MRPATTPATTTSRPRSTTTRTRTTTPPSSSTSSSSTTRPRCPSASRRSSSSPDSRSRSATPRTARSSRAGSCRTSPRPMPRTTTMTRATTTTIRERTRTTGRTATSSRRAGPRRVDRPSRIGSRSMCGICGSAEALPGLAFAQAGEMAHRLAHRGPGDRIVVEAGGVALAASRLHVTSPRAPSGPYAAAGGLVTAAVNGEIWNHTELRRELISRGVDVPDGADTAVVAPLYATEGVAGLARLSGMFAAAIHDARDGSTVLARDRFGIKPLYWQTGPALRFASEAGVLPGGGGGEGGRRRNCDADNSYHRTP